MSKITIQKDSTLLVPDVPTVPYITGDGVGAEVTPSMQIIVDAAVRKAYGGKRHIEWLEVPAGERAFNETGSWLPEETMQAFQEYLVGIKGPLLCDRHLIYMSAFVLFVGIREYSLR